MRTRPLTTDHKQRTTDHRQRDDYRLALRRGLGFWELTFGGQRAVFKHDQGALYVACLLLDPPPEPVHAMALALKARKMNGQARDEAELIQERNLGLDDAEAVRNLRRKQRALETVLDDDPADSFGPGQEPWRGEGKLVGGGVLYLQDIPQVGKLGLTVTWHGRNGQVRRILTIPKNPRTDRQLEVRDLLLQQARRFDALTDVQQDAWNVATAGFHSTPSLGQSGPLTGLQLFVRVNSKLSLLGQAPVRPSQHDGERVREPAAAVPGPGAGCLIVSPPTYPRLVWRDKAGTHNTTMTVYRRSHSAQRFPQLSESGNARRDAPGAFAAVR